MDSGISSFPVTIENVFSFEEAAAQVSERLISFCNNSLKGGECEVQDENRQINFIKRTGTCSTLKSASLQGLQKWHGSNIDFLMEFRIQQGKDDSSRSSSSSTITATTTKSGSILVEMTVFCHRTEAMKEINRIKSIIGGEINRTNRKWRRKFKAVNRTVEDVVTCT